MNETDPALDATITNAVESFQQTQAFRGDEILVYTAIAFGFGVLVSILIALMNPRPADNPPPTWLCVACRALVGVVVFFLTQPAQAYVLTHNWSNSPLTPFDWMKEILSGSGRLQLQCFAFGLVAFFGVVSFDIFMRVQSLVTGILQSLFSRRD